MGRIGVGKGGSRLYGWVTDTWTKLAAAAGGILKVELQAATANVGKVDPNTSTSACYNKTLTSADTEYSQALPTNCRGFEFQSRTEADVRFAFATGKVATPTAPYMTLKAGDYYVSFPLSQGSSPETLYLASATAGVVVEILAWT